MDFEADLGIDCSGVVSARAHLVLGVDDVVFGRVEDLSDYFKFLLVTDLVDLWACFFVEDFGGLGVLLFLKA
jgi:hypothetical protein